MLEITSDFSQIDRLNKALKAYQVASNRTLAFAMIHTARNMAFSLKAETRKIAPPPSAITAVPDRFGWRPSNKIRKHRSTGTAGAPRARLQIIGSRGVSGEILRRIRHIGYSANGWSAATRGFKQKDSAVTVIDRLGGIVVQVDEKTGSVSILMYNRAGIIADLVSKHQIIRKAVEDVLSDFAPYIESHLGADARASFLNI